MTKDKNDDPNAAEDDQTNDDQTSSEENADDESSDKEPERFERPDNLRRRSEWFQKRSGGR